MYIMMKKNSYISLVIGGVMSLGLISCSDDSQEASGEGLSVVVFSPTQAVPGETVTIVGSGLDKVEAVTFFDDNRVTDIQVINENQIKVKLPSSLEEVNGKVTVEAGGEAVTAGLDIEIVNPSITAYTPLEVQANNELELSGKYLDKIAEIIFPGNNVVKAIDFIRKSGNVLRVNVPEDIPTCSESITLVTKGEQNVTSPVINFKEKPQGEWVEEETIISKKKVENASLTEMLKLQEAIEVACSQKRNQLQDQIRIAQQNSIEDLAFDNDLIIFLIIEAVKRGRVYFRPGTNHLIIELYNEELGKTIFKVSISTANLITFIENFNFGLEELDIPFKMS